MIPMSRRPRKHPRRGAETEPTARGGHLTAEHLERVARGLALPATHTSHARSCGRCRPLLEAARLVASASRGTLALEAVPPREHTRALRAFDRWVSQGQPGVRERLAAVEGARALVSRAAAWGRLLLTVPPVEVAGMAAGVRSTQRVTRCELSGGGYRVEVEWTPAGGAYSVRGRVRSDSDAARTPPAAPRLSVELDDRPPVAMRLTARGFFGPVHSRTGRLRASIRAGSRRFRSGWLTGQPSRRAR